MGLSEALTELDGVDAADFAAKLQDTHPTLYKSIYTEGYGAGKTSLKDDLDAAQKKVSTLESEREKLNSKLEDLKGEQPEAAELRGKYEQKLEDLQAKIQAKEQEKQDIQSQATDRLRSKEQQFFRERAKGWLMQHGGVADPDIADIKVERAMQRVQFDDDLQPKVYEEDGEVPTPIPDGKQPHEVFASSVLESIPDKFIENRSAGSTGLGSTNGSSNGRTYTRDQIKSMSDAEYAKNREDIMKAQSEGRVQ